MIRHRLRPGVYANYFHFGLASFKGQVGNPAQDSGWGLEESLDVEQACALAPQANIVLVEANSNSFDDLLAAAQVAYTQYHATVVSMSFGGGEFQGEQQSDSVFCNITNQDGQPVTFVASTGDSGHGAQYPASSPCVIAVGGTVLALASTGTPASPTQINYGSENGWRSGGGGVSSLEAQPSWQNPACWYLVDDLPLRSGHLFLAVNVPVYDTFGHGGWLPVNGTSISAPDWARSSPGQFRPSGVGKSSLSQAAPDLYSIFYSANYLSDFHDIIAGTNGNCGSQCTAVAGYDLVTGIGSYKANTLYPALVADPN